jgi:hypothetical protein
MEAAALSDRTLRTQGGQPIFCEDQEHMLVFSTLKISAYEFGTDLDDVKKVTL